jgi:hypothetical protein
MPNVYDAKMTRRHMLRLAGTTIACAGTARIDRLFAAQEALPHLTDANPAAASLGYTEDASTIDSSKFPKHKPGQRCASCKYFQPSGSGGQYGPCQLYPGSAVNMNGWCTGYLAA